MVEKRRSDKIKRNDFYHSLIDLMGHEQLVDNAMLKLSNGTSAETIAQKLNLHETAAQAFLFFLAGFETSSSVATHCIYELALNLRIQEKLQEEIDEFLKNVNGFNFEDISKLQYLDTVFHEAARMHPTIPFLNRVCHEDYQMPNSNFVVPKGTGIVVSVTVHNDPNIYHEPNKFDPLRFNSEDASRHLNMHLTFDAGPRTCIGKRLGILQSKTVIFYLLENYTFFICDKTPIPTQYSTHTIVQTPRDELYLKAEKRRVSE